MAFRNISDIIHYFRGDWNRENDMMDSYMADSNRKLQAIVDNYDDGTNIGQYVSEYGNDVYILGMLCGARFGRNEVMRIISKLKENQ